MTSPPICPTHPSRRSVPGIGAGVLRLIEEFRDTGRLDLLARSETTYPREVSKMRRLPRMTPIILRSLKGELGVDTSADLIAAIEAGGVEALRVLGRPRQSDGHARCTWLLRPGRSWAFRPTSSRTPSPCISVVTSEQRPSLLAA